MAAKNRPLRHAAFAVLFLFLVSALPAQERIFRQRLSWTGDGNVLRYEVIIEREEGGGFREASRTFREEPYIYVSLSPGRYRYRVIPHDFLNRPGTGSAWMYFEIRAALDPQLSGFSPA
ncbi:MAG: hypothetical protein FWB99_09465, partial [Treponema sp.]|nr:hypothetical protein [Treponema sp.]